MHTWMPKEFLLMDEATGNTKENNKWLAMIVRSIGQESVEFSVSALATCLFLNNGNLLRQTSLFSKTTKNRSFVSRHSHSYILIHSLKANWILQLKMNLLELAAWCINCNNWSSLMHVSGIWGEMLTPMLYINISLLRVFSNSKQCCQPKFGVMGNTNVSNGKLQCSVHCM